MNRYRVWLLLGVSIAGFACVPPQEITEEALQNEAEEVSGDNSEQVAQASEALTNVKVIMNCFGSGYKTAVCEAYCPAGYLATGGGCSTSTEHWEVFVTRPTTSGEGWRCEGSEDYGSKFYNQSVNGYVVCIQM